MKETYGQMIRRFNEGYFSGLVTVTRGEDITKGGLNFFDSDFCMKRVVEKPGPEQLEQLRSGIPLGRIGRPEEIGEVVAFLATDAASFIIGETIHVNGGLYMT